MKLLKNYYRLRFGIESPFDVVVKVFYYIRARVTSENPWVLFADYTKRRFVSKWKKNEIFDFNGILFPDFSMQKGYLDSFLWAYFDILFFYVARGDKYPKNIIDAYDKYLGFEGTYCYEDPGVMDIMVKKGDVVIDAGAWIGPFSAYASKKGASVYAFEPARENRTFLDKTAKLNGNIEVIPFALYDSRKKIKFLEDSMGSKIDDTSSDEAVEMETTTLDDFVRERKIAKIDFIKADIEGAERNMLLGARWVLKNFAPKLSICTYHLPDDPKVLAKIITDANPRYKISQRRMKLYAEVS